MSSFVDEVNAADRNASLAYADFGVSFRAKPAHLLSQPVDVLQAHLFYLLVQACCLTQLDDIVLAVEDEQLIVNLFVHFKCVILHPT